MSLPFHVLERLREYYAYLSDVVVYRSGVAVMPASLLGGGGASSVAVAIGRDVLVPVASSMPPSCCLLGLQGGLFGGGA